MIDAYLKGDSEELAKLITQNSYLGVSMDEAFSKKFTKHLIYIRNEGMAKTIIKDLKADRSKSCFFAAGAGHYVGKKTVGDLLKKNGYTVTRVK